jgi:mannose-6-phosphate isomerase-like protein (cupin superfamily)
MIYNAINLQQKLSLFAEQWTPKVIAEMNDYQFKVVKLQGDFVWHSHKDTDETFIVIEGDLRIDFRDGAVHLAPGEMFVVPKGKEHRPFAEREVMLMLIEPRRPQHWRSRRGTYRPKRRVDLARAAASLPRPAPAPLQPSRRQPKDAPSFAPRAACASHKGLAAHPAQPALPQSRAFH